MKYPMKQYLGGIVEALKAAPGNDVPDSQLPNVLVAIARVTRAASEEASTKSKFAAANGFAYVKDAQTAIMATLDKASEELVEKRG